MSVSRLKDVLVRAVECLPMDSACHIYVTVNQLVTQTKDQDDNTDVRVCILF